jgi:hypothetical protein
MQNRGEIKMDANTLKKLRADHVKEVQQAAKVEADLKTRIEKLVPQYNEAKTVSKTAQDRLAKFDAVYGVDMGIKKGETKAAAPVKVEAKAAVPAKKAAKTPAKKAAKAAPAKAKAAPAKTLNRRATAGRRAVAEGLRPTIRVAIATVMGEKTMNAAEIVPLLEQKGWQADTSDQKTYIGYMLSQNKETFERVEGKGRGFYRVKPNVVADVAKAY